jgi:hypothetical protein
MALLAKSLEFPEMKQKLNTHHVWKCLHCTLWENYVLSINTKTQAQTDFSVWPHEFGIQYATVNSYHSLYMCLYMCVSLVIAIVYFCPEWQPSRRYFKYSDTNI